MTNHIDNLFASAIATATSEAKKAAAQHWEGMLAIIATIRKFDKNFVAPWETLAPAAALAPAPVATPAVDTTQHIRVTPQGHRYQYRNAKDAILRVVPVDGEGITCSEIVERVKALGCTYAANTIIQNVGFAKRGGYKNYEGFSLQVAGHVYGGMGRPAFLYRKSR